MFDAYNIIISALQSKELEFKIFEHEPVTSLDATANNLPFQIEKLVKTLVYRFENSYWILVALKVDDKIDFGKLAKCLNIARDRLKRPDVKEIETELGFQIGGIGPFSTKQDVRIVFDKKVLELDKIYCGIGRNDRSLEIAPGEIVKEFCSLIYDVTR